MVCFAVALRHNGASLHRCSERLQTLFTKRTLRRLLRTAGKMSRLFTRLSYLHASCHFEQTINLNARLEQVRKIYSLVRGGLLHPS